jgi:hypothetical protein
MTDVPVLPPFVKSEMRWKLIKKAPTELWAGADVPGLSRKVED